MAGMTTKIPHRPNTTLGMAASISMMRAEHHRKPRWQKILGQEDRDRQAKKAADQQRQQRTVERSPDPRQDAEIVLLHIPDRCDQKVEMIFADRRQSLTADLPEDIGDE